MLLRCSARVRKRKYNAIIDSLMTQNALNGQGSRGVGGGARSGGAEGGRWRPRDRDSWSSALRSSVLAASRFVSTPEAAGCAACFHAAR